MTEKNHFFVNGGVFEKTLRFLNMLEDDDGMVLSISNCAVYTTLAITVYCLLHDPTFFVDSLGAYGIAKANYAYKRWTNIPRSPDCGKPDRVDDVPKANANGDLS